MKGHAQMLIASLVAAGAGSSALAPAGVASAQEKKTEKLAAEGIAARAFRAVKLDGAEMVSTLTIYNAAGQARVRKTAGVSKLYDNGRTEKRLVRFMAPADVKGTGLLTYDYEKKDDDLWLFMPALRKTRRIVSSEKAKNFMGSEFTYADMTPPAVEDFQWKILREEKAGGVECWVLESTPRNEDIAEENGFSKKIIWLGKADFVVRKAVFHDLDGELHKELTARDVSEIDQEKHRFRPLYLEMVNRQNRRHSTLKVEKIQLRRDVPDEYFTTRYLERQ